MRRRAGGGEAGVGARSPVREGRPAQEMVAGLTPRRGAEGSRGPRGEDPGNS